MSIKPEDITNEVCMICARCCTNKFTVEGDLRRLEFLEVMYGDRLNVTWRGECECGCGVLKFKGAVSDTCPELIDAGNGRRECARYESRPQLCADFNCATWALVHGHEESEFTRAATEAHYRLMGTREEGDAMN